MNHPEAFFPPNAFRFGGGGSGGGQAAQIAAAAPPAVAPPVTAAAAEVAQAQRDVRRQSLKKRGFSRGSIFAGDTGGFFPGNTTPGPDKPKLNPQGGASSGATKLGG